MIDDLKRRLANIDIQLESLLMKKKLKINFWKTEKALAMQVVEQEGLPKEKVTGNVKITCIPEMYRNTIYLRGDNNFYDFHIDTVCFDSNEKRDAYLDNMMQAITDELFSGDGELKVGELCEVSNDNETWEVHPLITILREGLLRRYIVNVSYNVKAWDCFEHARPIAKRIEPKIETKGEITVYTWEEE